MNSFLDNSLNIFICAIFTQSKHLKNIIYLRFKWVSLKNKSRNILKSIALSVIILGALTFGIARSIKKESKKDKLITTGTSILPVDNSATLRDSIVYFGMQYLGKPYMAGASCEEGFDCSGFVYFVFKHFKIDVP